MNTPADEKAAAVENLPFCIFLLHNVFTPFLIFEVCLFRLLLLSNSRSSHIRSDRTGANGHLKELLTMWPRAFQTRRDVFLLCICSFFCALFDEVVTIRSEHAQSMNLAALDMCALNAASPERGDVCSAEGSRGACVIVREREESALKFCRVCGGVVDFHFLALQELARRRFATIAARVKYTITATS
jgi:hypothetical protein